MPTEPRGTLARNRAVLLDSFAWIEYFNGTTAGEKVQSFLEAGRVLTPAIVVAELSEKHKRLNREFGPKYDFVKARTSVVPLEEELARVAGELNFERKKRVKGLGNGRLDSTRHRQTVQVCDSYRRPPLQRFDGRDRPTLGIRSSLFRRLCLGVDSQKEAA